MQKKAENESIKVSGRTIPLTNTDKILFPKSKITKQEVIDYYLWVSKWMLPLIKNRPISMHRFPSGIDKEGFFQKNISDYFPKWVGSHKIKTREKGKIEMVVCNDKPTLIYLANQACITPHIWLSTIDKIDYPDRMIFDLDPPGKDFKEVMEGAKIIHELLDHLGLSSYPMTTGSKGLHIVIPIKKEVDFTEVRMIAKDIASLLCEKMPKMFTTEQRKNKRKGRIFIDYLRNAYGQTGVAPFAIRAIEGAPIAMPLSWQELKGSLHSQSYNIKNIKKKATSPWKGMRGSSIKSAQKKLEKILAKSA